MLDIAFIDKMKHSPIHNYAVPGLTSWLIGAHTDKGCVRLFECERDHVEPIIPHSHRFDLHCLVLAGTVRNVLWVTRPLANVNVLSTQEDAYTATDHIYGGKCGEYKRGETKLVAAYRKTGSYSAGQTYGMKASEVHSIYFSKGAKVLFFEGPQLTDTNIVLEPFVAGETVPTFKVEPWMFTKE